MDLVQARKDSPVIIGAGETGAIVASDIVAIVGETRDAVVLENDTFARMACVDGEVSVSYRDFDGEAIDEAYFFCRGLSLRLPDNSRWPGTGPCPSLRGTVR